MIWIAKHSQARPDMLGFLPSFLSESDPRPAKEQIHTAYAHGGGWYPQSGFTLLPNGNLAYPGDPPIQVLFEANLREEVIRFYDCEFVAIIQPDGTFEVDRID